MVKTVFYITPSVELLGARVSLVELVTHLNPSRYRPVVICPKPGPLTQRLKEFDIETRIIRYGNWRKVKHWHLIPGALFNLTELCREEKTALWHSNEFWVFPYAYLTSKRLNIPAVCHFRCSRPPSQLPPKKMRTYYVHRANRIIAVSRSQQAIFKDIPEVDDKFLVVPNGVDLSKFEKADREIFRHELGMNGSEFLVGIVGPVSEHKGVEEFVMAAQQALQTLPNIRFVIVGPDRPATFTLRMKEMAKNLNLSDKITFTGFRHDIPNVMAGLDVLVTPSRVEAFGRVILEAMASSTPIIASQVGGIPEIITNAEFGVLIAPQQASSITEALISLLNDPDRRKRLAKNALARVATNYSIQYHADQIQSIYDQVLSEWSFAEKA